MKMHPSHREENNIRRARRRCRWPVTAAVVMSLAPNAPGGKTQGGGTAPPPPPSTALYNMERIPQPAWGGDHHVENISQRGDATGVTSIKSGRYNLAGVGFFWDRTTKLMSKLLPLPSGSTGPVVHNASWAGGISDDGRIIYGASLRSVAEGLTANPHQDFTPVVWMNTGTPLLTPVNFEGQLLAYSSAHLLPIGWDFASFQPDFGPTTSRRLTDSGEFLFLEAVTTTGYLVDVVARLGWSNPASPEVTGMWVLGQRRTSTAGGFNGNAFSIVEGTRLGLDGLPKRVVSVAGSYRSFDENGQPTPDSAAAQGSMPMNWELDVESGVASLLTLSHLNPAVNNTTGWGIDVNAVGATVGLAKAVGEEISLAYYWEPDGTPIRPAELPGSNNAMRLYALNAAGQAVGYTTTGTNYANAAILWSAVPNSTRSLTTLAGGSVSFEAAVDINERGQIAVLDAASPSRWYLLTPKP